MIHLDPALIAPAPVSAPVSAPAEATAGARARIEGQMAMLDRLAQVGMEIAEACGRAAAAPEAEPAPMRDPGLVFARVARAVRMTIALQSRLAKDLAALDRADDQAQASRKSRHRMRMSQLVEQAARDQITARREAGGRYWADEDAVEDEIEQLSCEAYERLTDAEDGDLCGRSFSEVVAGICADLGLSPDGSARLLATMAPPPGAPPDPDPPPRSRVWTEPAAPPLSSSSGRPPGSAEGRPEDRLRGRGDPGGGGRT